MLVCPKCGFEKEAEPGRKLEFCPADGSAMRIRQTPVHTSTAEFQFGLRKLQRELVPGSELKTIGERETFKVLKVSSMEVVIAPTSSMKERPIAMSEIEMIHRRWLANGRSYTSSDYQAHTVNSVYILRLVRDFWDIPSG